MLGNVSKLSVVAVLSALAPWASAAGPPAGSPALRAEVLHWWTSRGEVAAARSLSEAFRRAGGEWIDRPVAGSEQARAVAIARILGNDAPTAALFNASYQYRDLIEQHLLANVDEVAAREGWARALPAPVLDSIRVGGHFYAAPVTIHSPTWIWYSKPAFRRAGIATEPRNFAELIADLERLKAAGLIPLAHGGQPWQENILFRAVLANVGGRDLYLRVLRDRDAQAIGSPQFRQVLQSFKRLRGYVDAGATGRNWNDATALLIAGRAGVQIMGDWVKGEFSAAGLQPGRDYGCLPGLGPDAPYVIQADVLVFPLTHDPAGRRAQQLLAATVAAGANELTFAVLKGSTPARIDVAPERLDPCARLGLSILRDPARQLGNDEMYLTPDQNGGLSDVLTQYWNRDVPVARVQERIAQAVKQ